MSSKAENVSESRTQRGGAVLDAFRARRAEAERARNRVRADFDDARIIAALASAASGWLNPESELRRSTVRELSAATGMHPEMLAAGLEFVFGAVTEASLRDLVAREARTETHLGPGTLFYALAGNVPGQSIPPIVASLLARSVAMIRDSARQPLLTDAFRESLARLEPDLAAMIVPVAWSSRAPTDDDRALERLVIDAAARIEISGRDATVSELATRYTSGSTTRVASHGTRMSAGIIDGVADLDVASERFAVDVVMYEGRGCLTPHALLVEGPRARANAFAERLALDLERLQTKWPRARGSLVEESTRRGFIDRAEAASLANVGSVCVGREAAWCIRIGDDDRIGIGPGLRCVTVLPTSSRDATLAVLALATTPLAAIGVAGEDQSGLDELAASLRPLGVTLICPAGLMQAPPIRWEQDGRRRLEELLGHGA